MDLRSPGQLVGMIFFTVCGGPYGVESAVKAAGPLVTLLGFCIVPLIWALPMGEAYPLPLTRRSVQRVTRLRMPHFLCVDWRVGWYQLVRRVTCSSAS